LKRAVSQSDRPDDHIGYAMTCHRRGRPGRGQPALAAHSGLRSRTRLRASDLSPQHRDLVTEHHDLRILGRLASAQQHQPAKDPDRDQVEQSKGHRPRSCRNQLTRPIRRPQYLRRVLKRYKDASIATLITVNTLAAIIGGAVPCPAAPASWRQACIYEGPQDHPSGLSTGEIPPLLEPVSPEPANHDARPCRPVRSRPS
jgi:hypothetical protein